MIDKFLKLYEDSNNTYCAYYSCLNRFFDAIGKTPEEFVELCKEDLEAGETIIQEYVDSIVNDEGKAIKSTRNVSYYAIRGFLKYYHVMIIRQIKVKGEAQDKYTNQQIPTQEELSLMFDSARNNMERVLLLLLAYTGLRPGIISGLSYKNFPEMLQTEDKGFKFKTAPTLIEIFEGNDGNKTKLHQHTFFIREGMLHLKRYLDEEFDISTLTPDTYLFPDMTTAKLRCIIKRLLGYAGINDTRPYVMRSYFIGAVTNSGINETLAKHYSSHSDINTRYAYERKLNETQINEMRIEFNEKIEPKIIRKQVLYDVRLNDD